MVKGVVVGEYSWKRGASSYIVCMRIVPVVWYMIEARGIWKRVRGDV